MTLCLEMYPKMIKSEKKIEFESFILVIDLRIDNLFFRE